MRTLEAVKGLKEGWESRSRSRRGGCPEAAESTWEEVLSEAVGGKAQGYHCFLHVVGKRWRPSAWPAQVSRRFILENRWDSLWSLGPPESPSRAWGLCRSLGLGPATLLHSPGSFLSQDWAHATSSS